MKIIAISDTHGKYEKLAIKPCDILISAGDYSKGRGSEEQVKKFHSWLNKQPATHLISVQGNHEVWVESNFARAKEMALENCPRIVFIDEGLVRIGDIKIWCSAITPYFYNWAWNVERGEEIKKHWNLIPLDTDIVVTHGPMFGVLDTVGNGPHLGCEELAEAIKRVKPKFHVFGHIHDSYGTQLITEGDSQIICHNASMCNELYACVNTPIEFEIEK